MNGNYWSCSKFANWVRGTPKPLSASIEGWNVWKKKAKERKIRYWLAEDGLDHLQNILCWPLFKLRDIRFYFNNRWVSKSHALTSNLKRGQWYDFDTRLLHAAFDELVNFVEIEQAWMQVVCSDENSKKYRTPWYRTIFRIGVWRCSEAGLDHLKWAADLKYDDSWIYVNPSYKYPSQSLDVILIDMKNMSG